jgi:hypothetical protein
MSDEIKSGETLQAILERHVKGEVGAVFFNDVEDVFGRAGLAGLSWMIESGGTAALWNWSGV